MDSKVVRADFGQWTDLPPGSNMLRAEIQRALRRARNKYADSGSACKLAGVQIIPLPTVANQILARTFFRSVAHLFACQAAGKFSRASSAGSPDFGTLYCLKWATSVEKRHGLPISEARRCSACAHPLACPAVGKFSRASSAGGRRHLL